MIANPVDRKLVTVFKVLFKGTSDSSKREKVGKEFRELRNRMLDAELGRLLDGLIAELSDPQSSRSRPNTDQAAKTLGELRARGLVESAAFLFLKWRDVMVVQKLEDLLPAIPDAASLEIWRKGARIPAKEIENRLLAVPMSTYETAGADWLLLHSKPEQMAIMLELFLGRKQRPKTLPSWADALVPALKKDKHGLLLEKILRHPWPDQGAIKSFGEVVRSNRTIFKSTVENLPAILCKKDAPEQGALLVDDLFERILEAEGSEREFVTAALARLGSGILVQDRRGPQADMVLRLIAEAARRLRNLTKDEADQARTWVLEKLSVGVESVVGKAHVTIDGARHLALAFEKAAQGFAAKDILSATMRNLGLTLVGKKSEAVSYDPLQHEDVDGGMVPGDGTVIVEPGWALGQDTVSRARVRRGGSRV